MSDFRLKSYEFRREREKSWHELGELVTRVERRGLHKLSAEELQRLPQLYRAVISSLSVARAISLDKNVIAYLDGLATRAYFAIYARRRGFFAAIGVFFAATFPRAVRQIRWAFALSLILMLLGVLTGYALTDQDPDRYYAFVGEGQAQGRTPEASAEQLEAVLYKHVDDGGTLAHLAAFLFTNNARIGILCFALGFAAGVPVMLLLFTNGAAFGAMWALYASKGLGLDFFAWVMPHGVTELLAIVLCGAAGLSIGYGVVFPGRYRRLDNVAIRGRQAAAIAMGAVAMLFVAALIEGILRQVVQAIDFRIAVLTITAIGWAAYFTLAGRRRERAEAEAQLALALEASPP